MLTKSYTCHFFSYVICQCKHIAMWFVISLVNASYTMSYFQVQETSNSSIGPREDAVILLYYGSLCFFFSKCTIYFLIVFPCAVDLREKKINNSLHWCSSLGMLYFRPSLYRTLRSSFLSSANVKSALLQSIFFFTSPFFFESEPPSWEVFDHSLLVPTGGGKGSHCLLRFCL